MTTPLFKKLNFKNQDIIYILNSPEEFKKEYTAIQRFSEIKNQIDKKSEIEFIVVFVKTPEEIENVLPALKANVKGDSTVWFAYPKGTSKKYKSEINRDKGWEKLRHIGFDTVRSIAIDNDWTGLRFRKIEFIKR